MPTGRPHNDAVTAAARAMYEMEWPGLKWDDAADEIQEAWRDLARVGLIAALHARRNA